MSAIFGIVNRNGEPVDADVLASLRDVSAGPATDRSSTWVDGGAGLGCCLRHVTPQDLNETHPSFDRESGVAFTAEGRLDNRTDLFEALHVASADRVGIADGELMRRAYLAWGLRAPDRLIGDWSFAAWHPRDRRLFVARDHFGNTGLHYAVTQNRIAFASSLRALLTVPWVDRQLNEVKFAGHFVGWRTHGADTFFTGISMLPPARYLVATPTSVDTVRYWRMEDTPDISLAADRDYVELLLDTYAEAVRCRLRAIRPVATTLSGGLDSSSVTALAARELRAAGRRLQAYTWVPGYDAGPPNDKRVTDEGPLADDLARIAGNVDVHRITGNVDPVSAIKRMVDVQAAPVVAPSNAAWVDETLRAVVDHGAGSLLTGIFGNATVSWTGLGSQSWREDARALGWPAAARAVVRPLLPAVAGRIYRRIRDGRRGEIMWPLRYAPIGRDFAERLDLERRLSESTDYQALFRIPADSRAARLQILFPDSLTTGAHWAALEAHYGVSFSAPTIDKRVLELCLGIPDRVFSGRDRQRRWLIREAMRGLVPDSIRLNPYRGAQGADLLPRLRAYGGSIDAALAESDAVPLVRELVDMARIRSAWGMVKNSQGQEVWSVAIHTLLNGLQAAIFLAAEFGR